MKLAYRIMRKQDSRNDPVFDGIVEMFARYAHCVDEVSLFEGAIGQGYDPLTHVEDSCRLLTQSMDSFRAIGIKNVGINVLVTLGHADDDVHQCVKPPFQTMVGPDGRISASCMCPNSPEFREYTRKKYQMLARLGPDFIWVDDDIRMMNHGAVQYACFCPICLSIFNQNNGTSLTREQLVARLNAPDGGDERALWVQQNTQCINELLALIGKTIHQVDPAIEIGLMTLKPKGYAGEDYWLWFSSLEAVRGRPGGGCFWDADPVEYLGKAMAVGFQAALYPRSVTDIQYEQESYPYLTLQKSNAMLILECTAAIANGVNGVAFNTIRGDQAYNDGVMTHISKNKSMWWQMDRLAGADPNVGLYAAEPNKFDVRRRVLDGNWFRKSGSPAARRRNPLLTIGIPFAARHQDACAVILAGNMAEGYTSQELIEILSGGVLIDGPALEHLERAGLEKYCGVRISRTYGLNVCEHYTDDPLNDGATGIQDTTALLGQDEYRYVVELLGGKTQVLNNLYSAAQNRLLGPTMTAYENELGGRVVFNGYMPWDFLYAREKISQTRSVCDWISRGRMPVRIRGCARVAPFIRMPEDRTRFLLMLINAHMDETGPFDVQIRVPGKPFVYNLNHNGLWSPVPPGMLTVKSDELIVHIHNIAPWQFIILASPADGSPT